MMRLFPFNLLRRYVGNWSIPTRDRQPANPRQFKGIPTSDPRFSTSGDSQTGRTKTVGVMSQGAMGGVRSKVTISAADAEVPSATAASHTQNTDTGTTGNTFTIDSDSTTGKVKIAAAAGASDKTLTITNAALTDNRTATLPNASGTVAFGTGTANKMAIWSATNTLGDGTNTDTDVADAVTKKHTQNTDTGTTEGAFMVNSDSTIGKIRISVTDGAADKSLTITNTALTDNRVATFKNESGTVAYLTDIPAAGGDFSGPASSTNEHIVVFDGAGGKTGKDGGKSIAEIEAGIPAAANPTGSMVYGKALANGSATSFARSDHEHGTIGNRAYMLGGVTECLYPDPRTQTPWVGATVGSGGTLVQVAPVASHPGIVALKTGTANNSGAYLGTHLTGFLIEGGEFFECIFYCETTTNLIARFGFMNSVTTTAPTNAIWVDIAGTTVKGTCADAGSGASTDTGSTYSLSADTWYRCRIVVNDAAGRVDFYLYDMAGTELWTNNVTTNIPTAVLGCAVLGASSNPSSTATEMVWLDWMLFGSTEARTR